MQFSEKKFRFVEISSQILHAANLLKEDPTMIYSRCPLFNRVSAYKSLVNWTYIFFGTPIGWEHVS